MAEVVYILCALTSLFCAGLLGRRYRTRRTRLLLWSMLGFIGLAINNALLVVDLLVVPDVNLAFLRVAVAVAAMGMFMVGLVWEAR